VVANAVSYLLSALGIRAIRGREPVMSGRKRLGAGEVWQGWRHVLGHPVLRPLFLNNSLVAGLILATAPLLTVLMLGELGFTPLEYGLAFGVPCVGGLVGSRLARPLVARFGQHRVMIVSGTVRAGWLVWLALTPPGFGGLLVIIVVELGLITSMGVFNPVSATCRLVHTPADRVARTLSAWTISSRATVATLTLLWGLLGSVTGTRTAIALAGVLSLATPLLLPRSSAVREDG
jgi:MFS family permease